MRRRVHQLWVELTSVETYEAMGPLAPVCAFAVRLQLMASLLLALWFVASCAHLPETARATSVLVELAQAAKSLHDGAREAAAADEGRAAQILRDRLPDALDAVDAALANVCAQGIPEHERMCRHYRAYKRGQQAVCPHE